jgi:hypothetical protein
MGERITVDIEKENLTTEITKPVGKETKWGKVRGKEM